MNSLTQVLKPKTSNKSKSSKNPAFYNAEKNLFIAEASIDDEAKVRMFVATNTHTPTKVLTAMLEVEQDKQVLKAVLLNDKMPRKAVAKFVSNSQDERVDWFEDDQEIVARFTK
jgi:ABC-type proline/glycine betaine transport system substrate-binding protein